MLKNPAWGANIQHRSRRMPVAARKIGCPLIGQSRVDGSIIIVQDDIGHRGLSCPAMITPQWRRLWNEDLVHLRESQVERARLRSGIEKKEVSLRECVI